MNRDRIVRRLSSIVGAVVVVTTVLATQGGGPQAYTFQCDGNCIGTSISCASNKMACCNAIAGTTPVRYECVCCDPAQ